MANNTFTNEIQRTQRMQREYKSAQARAASSISRYRNTATYNNGNSFRGFRVFYDNVNPDTLIAECACSGNRPANQSSLYNLAPVRIGNRVGWECTPNWANTTFNITVVSNQEGSINVVAI